VMALKSTQHKSLFGSILCLKKIYSTGAKSRATLAYSLLAN
jgi:hypothetical protein